MTEIGIWSLLPPLIAIVLAVVTKEVIFSLACGVLSGTVIYAVCHHLGIMGFLVTTVELLSNKLGANVPMILFLCLLGAIVTIIAKVGGSAAYADWAGRTLKSRTTATAATAMFSTFLFIDDYFNCITSGTVMRPVTDKFYISREKLAYVVDMMAAAVAILVPISSWAASVMSYIPTSDGMTGMEAFLYASPMNLYAVGTVFMVFWMCLRKNADYGPMAVEEKRMAAKAIGQKKDARPDRKGSAAPTGAVKDLVLPVGALILLSVFSMLYIGGYWGGGKSLMEAFGDTDAPLALCLAGFATLLFTFILFVPSRKISLPKFFEAVTEGVKSMVSPCMILVMAWGISGVCRDLLMTGDYVAMLVKQSGLPVQVLPAAIMVVAGGRAFATGTSWGTFGLLIPVVTAICQQVAPELTVTALSAVLAGSVFGDQVSPISDVVILSAASADCEVIRHVTTQLPYAVTVAACAVVGYLVAGFTIQLGYIASLAIAWVVFFALLVASLLILPKLMPGTPETVEEEAYEVQTNYV